MGYKTNNKEEFISLVKTDILTTSEVIEILGISRQALHSLVKRGKLNPIKEINRDRFFLREDVAVRKEESKSLQDKYRPYDN